MRTTITSLVSLAIVCCLVPSGAAGGVALGAERERPNVVFILCDDLGYGDLSCYGANDLRTPRLDDLALRGVRLTDCYSNGPVCTPTRAAFITGRYQQRVGLEWAIGPGMQEPGLAPTDDSLPRLLKNRGYATALVGKWHLGYRPEFEPAKHGFDEFFGIKSGNVDHYTHREINGEADLYENGVAIEREGYMTDLLVDRAKAFIDRNADSPFFLYLAFNTVHWPFQAPGRPQDARTRETWFDGTRADYVQMVEHADRGIGEVLDALARHGLTDDTLVIFTSDNGGERLSRMGPLAQSKGTLWEGGVRVPGIVCWPRRLPAGQTDSQPVITMDFTASILAATGAQAPELDGRDVLPMLAGEAPPAERTFFWRIERKERSQRAARQGHWKYLRDGQQELLFDLSTDVGEKRDLAASKPDRVAAMRRLQAEWEQAVGAKP